MHVIAAGSRTSAGYDLKKDPMMFCSKGDSERTTYSSTPHGVGDKQKKVQQREPGGAPFRREKVKLGVYLAVHGLVDLPQLDQVRVHVVARQPGECCAEGRHGTATTGEARGTL